MELEKISISGISDVYAVSAIKKEFKKAVNQPWKNSEPYPEYQKKLLADLAVLDIPYKKSSNRTFIIGFMKRLLPKILCTFSTIDEINRLYSEAVRSRSQIMPGRTFKRKKNKAKGRTHFNNQKVSF